MLFYFSRSFDRHAKVPRNQSAVRLHQDLSASEEYFEAAEAVDEHHMHYFAHTCSEIELDSVFIQTCHHLCTA